MEQQRVEPGKWKIGEAAIDLPTIEFDWVAYFRVFSARHGGYPVKWTDKFLLFRDGWRYSAFDYQGPEYPPPPEPEKLHNLQTIYWSSRQTELSALRESLFLTLEKIKTLSEARDAPLQQVQTVFNDQDGFDRRTVPLNINEWYHRLQITENLLGESVRILRVLSETKKPIQY